jgi:hypothetical protein
MIPRSLPQARLKPRLASREAQARLSVMYRTPRPPRPYAVDSSRICSVALRPSADSE